GSHTASDALGNSDPQLTLVKGSMSLSSTKTDLVVSLTIADLSATVPTGASAADWYATWSYDGTTYFAQAQLGALPESAVTYADGTIVLTGSEHQYESAHTDTGSFKAGKDGIIQIDVPLANIGAPAAGAVLANPAGLTYTEEGVPPNPSGEGAASLQSVDSGGPTNNYKVGSTCPA
ncbi:MAG TPA: hypothetical protein VGP46_11365, partial [Acidimicrobiales bacterium]|nr:hypothetical protein [Acidimicrobiales bacterium]